MLSPPTSESTAAPVRQTDRTPIVLSWSGGKDSALALQALRADPTVRIVGLLCTVSREFGRISHHGVRETLLEQQAEAVGVPLHRVYLPSGQAGPCTNDQYEDLMRRVMLDYQTQGVGEVAFGDLFLEDLRRYREQRLAEVGMHGRFPLWGSDTRQLAERFIEDGFAAYLSCVDGRKLHRSFAGRRFDRSLVADLPATVDPCGENGEFHSFVHDGPIFTRPVPVTVAQTVERDNRYFTELLPSGVAAETQTPAIPPVEKQSVTPTPDASAGTPKP